MTLHVRTGSCCLRGNYRESNEDCVAVARWCDAVVCVVADGAGGQEAGARASEAAVTTLLACLSKPGRDAAGAADLDAALRAAFVRAHANVLAIQPGPNRGGSTAVLLLWPRGADQVHVAYLGDSLGYRLSRQGLKLLTPDTAQLLLAAGMITEEQARQSRGRFRCFLGLPYLQDSHLVKVNCVPIEAGDRFLLCSDGLSNNATDEQMAALLKDAGDAQERADRLAQLALDQGSRDNVSCIVIDVEVG